MQVTCKRCGKSWEPNVEEPKKCRHCGNKYWNSERLREMSPDDREAQGEVLLMRAEVDRYKALVLQVEEEKREIEKANAVLREQVARLGSLAADAEYQKRVDEPEARALEYEPGYGPREPRKDGKVLPKWKRK